MDDLDDYLTYLRAAGVTFDVAASLERDVDQLGQPHAEPGPVRELQLPGLPPIREHRDPAATLSADHATLSVATAMLRHGLVRRGEPFWDVGCGTGVLAIAAALSGASPVLGTDVDTEALELARQNVQAAGVDVELAERSLLGAGPPIGGLVATNLPQKPRADVGHLALAQDGGPDGDLLFSALLDEGVERLRPGARLVFFLHSLPHPRLLARIGREFALSLIAWKRRFLDPGEYGALQETFMERHRAAASYVGTDDDGRRFLVCGVWLAERR